MIKILNHPHHTLILTSFEDPRYKDLSTFSTPEIPFIQDPLEAYRYALSLQLHSESIIVFTGSIHFIGFIGSKIKHEPLI